MIDADRFWSKVEMGDGCWLWQGTRSTRGYGQVWADGRSRPAHRVAWELVNGPMPAELDACHHCMDGPWWKPPSTLTYQQAMRHYATELLVELGRTLDAS